MLRLLKLYSRVNKNRINQSGGVRAKNNQDGRTKLNREGGMEWFLGVRYSFNREARIRARVTSFHRRI